MTEANASAETVSDDQPAPGLDDLMMAMDVVDTLRHQEKFVEKEFGQAGRDDVLKTRLREIYESQGLEVSDQILDEGIRSLHENRFTYDRKGSRGRRMLAMLWVRRGISGTVAAIILVALIVFVGNAWWQASTARNAAEAQRVALEETLPANLDAAAAAANAQAVDDSAKAAVDNLRAQGAAALQRGDADAANAAIASLAALRDALGQTYDLVIVQSGQSGVFRIPDVNSAARNYYLIVEAVAPDGSRLSVPVTNEETGAVETVSTWGVRVPEATLQAVRNDKEDDGIIQNRLLGNKPRGTLDPQYRMPVSGGTITEW